MSFLNTDKKTPAKSLPKHLISTSAVSVLSGFMLMAATSTAHAQFTPDVTITDCADIVDNPGANDDGIGIAIDVNGTCNVTDGDVLELEDGNQDDVVIQVRSGTILIANDTSDEDVVFFVDNSENDTTIEVEDGAELRGANGVIFLEGDSARIVNRGNIIGTGEAEEGVIYIDRDTDGGVNNENIIINDVTGTILAQAGGPAIGVELLIVDGLDDAADVGMAQPASEFPFVRIVNRAGGLIQANFAVDAAGAEISDDNDAINIAGNRGDTGGVTRECIEGALINCQINLNLINSGTIRTTSSSSSNAAINFEDDAVFNGRIANLAGGVIAGERNGIRIDDIDVNGATAEHTGFIANRGLINGVGASGRGIDLEGSGVRTINFAPGVISGGTTGIEVGDGNANLAENNVIVNRGTITGGSFSVDSSDAGAAIRIVSQGGTFNGDIRGSAGIQDELSIHTAETNLTHDVLGDFNVRITTTGTLSFTGNRTIEGNLFNRGTLELDLANTHTVTGDLALRGNGAAAPSEVFITDATNARSLGSQHTLIEVGGTFTQNGALIATDSSILLDFEFVESGQDLVVEAVAAGTGSTNAKVSAFVNDIGYGDTSAGDFGATVLTAFLDGGLNDTNAFSDLAGISEAGNLGTALNSLAPDLNGTLVQNVSNTLQAGSAQISHRLNDLNCNTYGGANGDTSCLQLAESGVWAQGSHGASSNGSLSLSAPTFFNNGLDRNNMTMTYGYDQVVDDSTVVGFSGSYTESDTQDDAFAVSSTDLDVVQVSGYAGKRVGNAHFVTKATYSHAEAETNRQSFDVIKSEVDINGFNVQSTASYNVGLGNGMYLQPEAGLHFNDITTGSYAEAGGLNLNVSEASSTVLDTRVGLTLGARKAVSENTRTDMFVTGAVRSDIYGSRDDLGFTFNGQAGSLAVSNVDQFAIQGQAGVNVVSGKNFSFGGAVISEFSDSQNSVGGSVQTKLRF